MSTKTIITIILSVIVTIFLVYNSDPVDFDFLVTTVSVSKLIVMAVCVLIGFIIGYMAGRPKTVVSTYDPKYTDAENDLEAPQDTMSKEDRDYIS